MTIYGIKVSKTGYDVLTTAIVNQTFNSEKNCLKIHSSGSGASTSLSTGGYITITHSLGYSPGFLLYWEVSDNGDWYANGGQDDTYVVTTESKTNTLVSTIGFDGGGTVDLKIYYYIFIDQGE